MKFDMHRFWKHVNSMDVFFAISPGGVRFDDNGKDAILDGCWCTQTHEVWFFTEKARLKITPEEYLKWQVYEPKGWPKL